MNTLYISIVGVRGGLGYDYLEIEELVNKKIIADQGFPRKYNGFEFEIEYVGSEYVQIKAYPYDPYETYLLDLECDGKVRNVGWDKLELFKVSNCCYYFLIVSRNSINIKSIMKEDTEEVSDKKIEAESLNQTSNMKIKRIFKKSKFYKH